MQPRFAILVVLMTLICPGLAAANRGIHVFDSDPDYREVVFRHGAITFSWCMTALLGLMMAVRDRGIPRFVGAALLLGGGVGLYLYFLSTSDVHWWAGTKPPHAWRYGYPISSSMGQAPFWEFHFRYPPDLVGIVVAFVITAAGWLLSFCIKAKPVKLAPQGELQTVVNDSPEPTQQAS